MFSPPISVSMRPEDMFVFVVGFGFRFEGCCVVDGMGQRRGM